MKLLAEDIFNKLSAIIPNTYFNQLPANIDASQNFCVYELGVGSSMNTLHEIDFEQEVDITVKVLSKDIGFLFDKVEDIRKEVLLHTANYYSAIVKNTVPVFFDENLKLSQYTIIFSVNRGSVPFTGTLVNKYAPDATAIVQDQDGNELARQDIPSGGSEIIEVQAGGVQQTAIIIDFDQSNSLLEYTIIAGVDQAGDYISEALTNVATVEYDKNGTGVSLPFSLADGDNLTVTITRTDGTLDSTVKISNV